MDSLIKKYRFLFISGIILLTVAAVLLLPKLSINPGFDEYIPKETGNRAYLEKLDSIFGGSEKIMVILTEKNGIIDDRSYQRIQQLTKEFQNLEGIERCLSVLDILDIRYKDGITVMDELITEIPS